MSASETGCRDSQEVCLEAATLERVRNSSLIERSCAEDERAKRSAEAVGCQNASVGERSALGGSNRASGGGRSGSENVGLSKANIGENPMPRKPKGSSARFVHGGVRRGRENAPSQCSSTRRYGAEVTHAILPGKARTTFNKRCRKVKEVGALMTGEPATEAPVNGGRNYNGPKVAKFLVG
ncbi:unnamed protein product [Microthlaspi erraticum]|uniref:Uncharacterized protein n=1 Tax=Microthlaspi erraticum TaxID=1685480 RepID=A0A6D2I566_9BRAS|nr:unnamed protein product [Microthlaspi erraticum]